MVRRRTREARHEASLEEEGGLGRPGGETSSWDVPRTGARRPRIKVSKTFEPILTERQKTVLRGKVRTARAWGRVIQMLEETGMTMQEFVAGLSNEEIIRGQLEDVGGRFRGRPPGWVPREFHRACIKELLRRGKQLWTENYLGAIEAMSDIAAGRGEVGRKASASDRIKAATFVIERLEGKVPERLVIEDEAPWQAAIEGIVADVSDEAVGRARRALGVAHTVVDGSFTVEKDAPPEVPTAEPVRPSSRSPRRGANRRRS